MNVGICIYCGSTAGLTDEHILPYALWGTDVLKKASCRNCARITSKFEGHVAKDILMSVRAYMGLRSRRKRKLPQRFSLDVVDSEGKDQTLLLKSKEQPAFVVFPEYELPGLMRDGKTQKGILISGAKLISFGVDIKVLAKKYNFKSLQHTITFKGNYFEKFLAKWAYCIAVNKYSLSGFREVYVVDDILGKKDTIGTYVGCDKENIIGKQAALGAFIIFENTNKEVAVRLKLFANSDTPEYIVVVGKLK